MDLKVYTKNVELSAEAEGYIQKKLQRLERHLKPITGARLEVSRTSSRSQDERVVAQVTLSVDGYLMRGQERGANIFAAIDAVADALDRQIDRYKDRSYRTEQGKKAARTTLQQEAADAAAPVEAESDAAEGTVVRTKRFEMKPMTVADAVIHMEMLSHTFFLFFNADTGEYNVVYRRHDGTIGVIEPELA